MRHVAISLLGGALFLTPHGARAEDAVVCSKPEAIETLQTNLDALFELGDCQVRAGLTASAWHSFAEAEAVAQARGDRAGAQRAAKRVAALTPQLTRVVFMVPKASRVPGLTVRLGDNTVPPSAWDTPIPVDPGVLRVSATAKGYRAWHVEIDARRTQGQQYRVNLPVLLRTETERRSADRGKAYRTAGVVTGSVGLAGLGAGALFGVLSNNSENTRGCAKGATQCASKSSGAGYANAAAVSLAVGSALLATGVTLFVLAPSADNQEKNALRVAARYAASGGRVQLEGVW